VLAGNLAAANIRTGAGEEYDVVRHASHDGFPIMVVEGLEKQLELFIAGGFCIGHIGPSHCLCRDKRGLAKMT
jgi:hypothetical protein